MGWGDLLSGLGFDAEADGLREVRFVQVLVRHEPVGICTVLNSNQERPYLHGSHCWGVGVVVVSESARLLLLHVSTEHRVPRPRAFCYII